MQKTQNNIIGGGGVKMSYFEVLTDFDFVLPGASMFHKHMSSSLYMYI